MARPNKQGVDYFPLDIHLDDKFKFIEIKYKLEGFAVLIKLMQRVYANGYWCKWTEDELWLFSDEIKADHELVQNVVNECLKREVFDQRLFDEHNILTSKGIQKRYKEMVRRRKDVEMYVEYMLIDGTFGVNDDINPASSKQEDGKSTQSKVNKTKVNKTKQKEDDKPYIPFSEIIDYLNLKAGTKYKSSGQKTKDLITARWNNGFTLDDFKTVIDKKVADANNPNDLFNGKYLRPETLFGTKFESYLNQLDGPNLATKTGTHKKQNEINWDEV